MSNQFHSLISEYASQNEVIRDFVEQFDTYLHIQKNKTEREHRIGLTAFKYGVLQGFHSPSNAVRNRKLNRYKNILNEYEISVDQVAITDEETHSIKVTGKGAHLVYAAYQSVVQHAKRREFLYSSLLVNLINSTELFFSSLISMAICKYPGIIATTERTLTMNRLCSFSSIDELRDYYINCEIDSVMHGSFDEWLKYISSKLKLDDVDKIVLRKDDMVETFQRRHLVIHNGLMVNDAYIRNVSEPSRNNVKKGDKLLIDKDYIFDRLDLFYISCVLIGLQYLRQIDKKDNARLELATTMAYNNMLLSRWHIAEPLSKYVSCDPNADDECKLIGKINYWLCKKRQGKYDEVAHEVEQLDVSALSYRFLLPIVALRNQLDLLFKLSLSAIKSEQVHFEEFAMFPVYEEMRNDDRFSTFCDEWGQTYTGTFPDISIL